MIRYDYSTEVKKINIAIAVGLRELKHEHLMTTKSFNQLVLIVNRTIAYLIMGLEARDILKQLEYITFAYALGGVIHTLTQ